MLTDPGDKVLDPFAGSCVTGEVCERMARRWVCCELDQEYVEGAKGRFEGSKDKLFTHPQETRRVGPYEIFPPNSLPIEERATPLAEDGGEGYTRPAKRTELED